LRPQEIALPSNVDSDLAVKAYIESLLFDADVAFGAAVDGSSDGSSDGQDASAATSINPSPINTVSIPSALGADDLSADASHVSANADVDAKVDALSDIDFDGSLDDGLDGGLDGDLDDGLDSQAAAEATKNNPFLKQLEAAQRRGRAKSAAGVGGEKVDNRPVWGRENFRCLAFNVAGLKLAVPVQFIDGMQPLDLVAVTSPLASSSAPNALVLGEMKLDRSENAKPVCAVLDTARLVMPERYDNAMKESYRYILTLKNCDWSIAVDSIGGEIGLSPQNVRWRSEHTRREWLAGTVVDKMCALIDIDLLNRQMMADAILIEGDA